jgi:Fe-S cluster assembly protein SufD
MNTLDVVEHYRTEFDHALAQMSGSGLVWLDERRKRGLELFEQLRFPTTRMEDWKYTRVRAVEQTLLRPAPETCLGLDEDDIAPFLIPGLDTYRLVFVNGQYEAALSTKRSALPAGLTVASVARTLQDDPASLEPHMGLYADPAANGFAALNAAFMADGAFVHLPRGVAVDKPIQLLFLGTEQQDESLLYQPRNLIVAEAGSEATIVEHYAAIGQGAYFTNVVTELVLAPNAGIRHYKVQRESLRAHHVATVEVKQARDSRFASYVASFGALLARTDLNSRLAGEGAECIMNGLYVVDGRQHVDFHTRIDHSEPHCTSNQFYKGVLDGRSRGVFNGKIYVHPGAQKTDSAQKNDNLLLSRHAEVDTKPQLEIYADDVKCAHGATVGQLHEDSIFYLRSRGLDEDAARNLLVFAFANELLQSLPLEPLRVYLEHELIVRLPRATGEGATALEELVD